MLSSYRVVLLGLFLMMAASCLAQEPEAGTIRIGIIGLDTSHAGAFAKEFNGAEPPPELAGMRVVAAYPPGSPDIPSSVSRVPQYTRDMQDLGVKIVDSLEQLVAEVDVVLLESNDGRPHLEQALPVFRAHKRVFIDKPVAGSLTDAVAIYMAAKHFGSPVFSASSLRYLSGAQRARQGEFGDVIGCDAHSPCSLEPTHPDLYWYGVHGVELLFTVMGTGCERVQRVSTPSTDVAVGLWSGGRVGTFRGIRPPSQAEYGGTVFGAKGLHQLGPFDGYRPLVLRIGQFFRTGTPPVSAEETLEMFAFMSAADESKKRDGAAVSVLELLQAARGEAVERLKQLGVDIEQP